jgi:metal-responsive CopG/Arc/MetJ family transcriptional regulator
MNISELLAGIGDRYTSNNTVCVRLQADLLKALDSAVDTHNSTRSRLMQQALTKYLGTLNNDGTEAKNNPSTNII